MSEVLRIRIVDVDFFGQGLHYFVISPVGFEGWDDGVDMRLSDTPFPQANGSYDLPSYLSARTVSISGKAVADSNPRLRWLRNKLTGVLAGGGKGRIQVDRDGDMTWAECRLASKTKFDEMGGQNVADFQIQLWCPDPRKYGEARTYTASVGSDAVGVHHRGNYNAAPKLTITGTMPDGYVLTIMGQVFTVTQPLWFASPHSIDYGDGRLRIGGAIVHGGLGWGFTPLVPPGVTTTLSIEPITTGTATAQLALLDTYI